MPAIDAIKTWQSDLIRKSLAGSVFIAPASAAAVDETTLFDSTTGDLKSPMVTGYNDLGYVTDAGAVFSKAITTSDITSWQSVTPTRSDITSEITTAQFTPQETNLHTIALYLGADETAITTVGVNGTLAVDEPATPVDRRFRLLVISVDESSNGEIAICRLFPNAKVTAKADQSLAKGDSAVEWGVTMTAYVDDTEGTAVRHLFGGAGFLARAVAMGFTVGT